MLDMKTCILGIYYAMWMKILDLTYRVEGFYLAMGF